MRSSPLCSAPFLSMLLLLVPVSSRASFEGFEPRGFPPPRPNGVAPEGTTTPNVAAFQINGYGIELDGRLDDRPWKEAEAGSGFYTWQPDRGKNASEETIFKVAYNQDAIYFAVACLEKDPANITTSLSRRDQISDSDLVSIYVDPYHDKDTGYNFRVNPEGVQEDAYMYNNGNRDQDWNAVWEAETYRDEDGWYAEIRIPFSSVRYRSGESMTWGLQVYRYMHGRGEDTSWVTWDREASGFISRFGELYDMNGVRAARQVEILPYFVARSTDPAIDPIVDEEPDEFDNYQNFGADLKYGVTADLTLNATFQPDFGQVEADPATLNLSPFETFFEEKRPFFVEGNRFYQMPAFTMFYSRRIGTGDSNSRIRTAAKLTGKLGGNLSLAGLYALTDVTVPGQAHNALKTGSLTTHYGVVRIGRDFSGGNHRIHAMQTAVVRKTQRLTEDDEERDTRDGYTSGLDFEMNFKDRMYRIQGAFVSSRIQPKIVIEDPSIDSGVRTGTGGRLVLAKYGGTMRGELYGRWESDELDINDIGFLSAPDEINTGAWVGWRYTPGEEPKLNNANLNFNYWRSWLYGGRNEVNDETGEVAWEYQERLPQREGGNINGYMQLRNYWGLFAGIDASKESRNRYITRGGPLMTRPAELGGWLGFQTDNRKPLTFEIDGSYFVDDWGGSFREVEIEADWRVSNRLALSADFGVWNRVENADYLDTIERDEPTQGIGGNSYVFGDLDQKTVDLTLRSNVLFSRSTSLELYLQPYLTVGDYTNAQELVEPDSDRLAPYAVDGFEARDHDFRFPSVNVNMVYRWEYRPGSTLFLVWTHARQDFQERADFEGGHFDNGLRTQELFRNEPENTILAKVSYWFSM